MSKLDIPNSWATSTLGECVEIIGGATPDSSNPKFFTNPGEGIPWVTPADLGKQKKTKYIANGSRDITEAGFNSCSTQLLPKDSILFSSRAPIGHVAISANPICTNQGFKSIKSSQFFSSPFLYYYLVHSKDEIAAMGSGTTFKEVSGSVMKQVELVVPPLEEQQRISNKIEATQSKINEIENCAKRADELIGKYRQALLQKAFRGRLVPQDPNDESATKLLDRIQNQRINQSEGKKRKLEDLPLIKPEEIPFEIPKSWEWVRLGNLLKSLGAGWSPKCEGPKRTSIDQWGVLKISAVSWGKYNPNEHKALPQSESPRPEIEVKVGQILLSRSNTRELVARSVLVESTPPHLMLSDLIIKLECEESISAEYINIYHNSEYARAYYERVAKGASSTMCKVSRGDVQTLLVPLPPLNEQQQIVSALRKSFEREEQFKSCILATRVGASSLMSSILTKAFQGTLVSQDPREGTGFDLVDKLKRESFEGEKK